MKRIASLVLLAMASSSPLAAQAAFDVQGPFCLYSFPIGCASLGDPENVSCNGLALATVDTTNGAGMPCVGPGFARIDGFNPGTINPPQGGPAPADGLVNELYIPIPIGALSVSFCWDFYNSEGTASPVFNDGMAVEVAGQACGPAIATLLYADTFTPLVATQDAGTTCATFAPQAAPAGPQTTGPIALGPSARYLRVKVWNGGDNSASSHAAIDQVTFAFAPVCTLSVSAPLGPGSIAIVNSGCTPGHWYLTAITLAPGVFPNGWFFGLDIGLAEVFNQLSLGVPFSGALDATGSSVFALPAGIPSSLSIQAVTAVFSPGFGQFTQNSPPVAFIAP